MFKPSRRYSNPAQVTALLFSALTLSVFSISAVSAGIVCDGRFQLIRGIGWHTSNYCANTYLARVARSYGRSVSDSEVRENPGTKSRICEHIGHDGRLIGICSDSNGGDFFGGGLQAR